MQAAKLVNAVGLPLHEIEDDLSVAEVLGLELDGLALKGRLAERKRWRLRQGVRAFLRRPLVSGQQL